MRYLIRVENLKNSPSRVFIDNVVLEGEEKELYEKMKDLNFVKTLDIHESFYFEKFKLVPENEVEFPEYKI